MDILVDDCLLHIFQFVDLKDWIVLGAVSTRWKRLISEMWRRSITMKSEILPDNAPMMNRQELMKIARFFAPLIHKLELNLEGPNIVISFGEAYKYVLDDQPQRQSFTNSLLQVLSECAFNIKLLYLRMVDVDWMLITKLLVHNKGLKSFRTFMLLEEVTDYLPDHLESIKWFHSNDLTEKYGGFMRRESKLKHLHVFPKTSAVADLTLQSVSKNATKLESLCLQTDFKEQDEPLMSLPCLYNFVYLKKLHLSGRQINLSEDEVFNIVLNCVELEQVKFCFLNSSNKAINHLTKLPKLKKLKLYRLQNVTQLKPVSTMTLLKTLSFRAGPGRTFEYPSLVTTLNEMPNLSKLIFPRELYLPMRVLCDIISLIAHRPQQVIVEPTENYFAEQVQIIFNNRFYMPLCEQSTSDSVMLILDSEVMNLLCYDLSNDSVKFRDLVYNVKEIERPTNEETLEEIVVEESFSEEEESGSEEE